MGELLAFTTAVAIVSGSLRIVWTSPPFFADDGIFYLFSGILGAILGLGTTVVMFGRHAGTAGALIGFMLTFFISIPVWLRYVREVSSVWS
jgi:hypothetical protein